MPLSMRLSYASKQERDKRASRMSFLALSRRRNRANGCLRGTVIALDVRFLVKKWRSLERKRMTAKSLGGAFPAAMFSIANAT